MWPLGHSVIFQHRWESGRGFGDISLNITCDMSHEGAEISFLKRQQSCSHVFVLGNQRRQTCRKTNNQRREVDTHFRPHDCWSIMECFSHKLCNRSVGALLFFSFWLLEHYDSHLTCDHLYHPGPSLNTHTPLHGHHPQLYTPQSKTFSVHLTVCVCLGHCSTFPDPCVCVCVSHVNALHLFLFIQLKLLLLTQRPSFIHLHSLIIHFTH